MLTIPAARSRPVFALPESAFPPRGFAAGDQNLYRYARNQPTTATDPSGLAPVVIDLPLPNHNLLGDTLMLHDIVIQNNVTPVRAPIPKDTIKVLEDKLAANKANIEMKHKQFQKMEQLRSAIHEAIGIIEEFYAADSIENLVTIHVFRLTPTWSFLIDARAYIKAKNVYALAKDIEKLFAERKTLTDEVIKQVAANAANDPKAFDKDAQDKRRMQYYPANIKEIDNEIIYWIAGYESTLPDGDL